MRYPQYLEEDYRFPDFYRIKVDHPRLGLKDPAQSLKDSLKKAIVTAGMKPGHRVAIGVGSRGIANLPELVSTICKTFKDEGLLPFIIPSMGSHGGAIASGQEKVLEKLGITEDSCGAPIVSSMAVKKTGEVFGSVPVYFSEDALEMDHTICLNRIKPHTKFKGDVESGIYKMLCVGMGKHKGALAYHRMALKYGFSPLLKQMGDKIIERTNFRFGIGVVEDGHDETMEIEAIFPEDLFEREAILLERAKAVFPKLPVTTLDVLVINTIGKEISGSGMDPNITGRAYDLMEDDFSKNMNAKRIAILNLSENTGGNAIGLGNADIITEKVYREIDYESTLMNALTSVSLRKAFIPIRLPNDRKAVQAAFMTLGPIEPDEIRAIIIRDTLHTSQFWISSALLPEITSLPGVRVMEKTTVPFDRHDELQLF